MIATSVDKIVLSELQGLRLNKINGPPFPDTFSCPLSKAKLQWLDDISVLVYIAIFLLKGWVLAP